MVKITIAGVGALGSHVTLLLRNEAELTLIDFDKVEQKNTLSQFHPKSSIRQNKAESLKKTMQFLFGTSIKAVPHKLTADNARELLIGDLIIDCLDNGEGRRVIQNFARRTIDDGGKIIGPFGPLNTYTTERPIITVAGPAIPCLHGALAANGEFGQAVFDELFKIDYESSVGAPTCEGGEFLPFVAVVAGYISMVAQTFLKTGKKTGFHIHPSGANRIQ